MKSTIKLFLILITVTTIVVAWLTHQLHQPRMQVIISILIVLSLVVFFVMNMLEHRDERRERAERESGQKQETDPSRPKPKRSDISFSLKERKSGLTWGGGNIKGSEATRGTKRKFMGKN
jgi:Ca2+/H+ antiporter